MTKRLVPIFLCVALLASAHAQTAGRQPQPAPSTAADAASTYDTDPAADPARPTVTSPAHIPPPGYLQFEQGFLQANTTPLGGPDSQFSLVQSTKIALNHYVMPFLNSQPYARSSTTGVASNDPGDLDLGLQIVLLDEGEGHSRMPTLAVSYIQRVRSGTSASLDVGETQRSVLLLASGDLLGFHYDTNALFNEASGTGYISAYSPTAGAAVAVPHDVHRAQFGQTLAVTHNLTQKLALTGEVWRFSQPFERGNAIGNLYAFGYTVRKTLVLDAGFSRGLTGTSTHWETFAGFTYLLPHRLWPLKPTRP